MDLGAPAAWPALEHVGMMQQPIQQRGDGGGVAEQLAPVADRSIGRQGTDVSVEPFHLFRYLDEQAFRFNTRKLTDTARFAVALKGIVNKRLTYTALTGSELPQTC